MDASVRSMVRVPRTHPYTKANIFSKIFFVWLYNIIKSTYKNGFEEDDIPDALPNDKSEILTNGLEKKWNEEKGNARRRKRTPNFMKALILEFGLEFVAMSFLSLLKDLLSVLLSPYLLGRLLMYFAPHSTVSADEALILAVSLSVLYFILGVLNVQFMVYSQQFAVRLRAACITIVYRKCLRLSQSALGGTSPGQIINLVSNDVARFELVCMMLMPMIAVPITSTILFVFIYQMAGPNGLVGVAVLFLILAVQTVNANLTAFYRMKIAKKTDERVRLMDEIVQGIQVIKLYAWEKPFQAFIESARKMELKVLRRTSYLRSLFMFFILFTSRAGLFCTLLALYICDTRLTASSVFVLMVYFNQLAVGMTAFLIRGFAEVAECKVSIRRIQEFLLRDEFKPLGKVSNGLQESVVVEGDREVRAPAVVMSGVSARWTHDGINTLTDINLDIRVGQLVAVIGTVGCGKSSLLNLLLGELVKGGGKMRVNGVVSYAAQEPWIFSSSVRQNILFREEYNPSRYKAVCRVCQLEKDFEQLPRGDKTLVGEKGASLSGGQKARINLARAIYKEADIYLLDDPLSAVDTHIGKHLFQNCIEEFLGDKTRILVTHQVQHLYRVNHLILMDNGRIQIQGTFKELRRSHFNFATVLKTPDQEKSAFQFLSAEPAFLRNAQRKSTRSERSVSSMGDELIDYEEYEEAVNDRETEQLTHMPTLQVCRKYLRAGVSPFYCAFVLFLFIFTQVLVSGYDYWLAYWLRIEEERENSPEEGDLWHTSTFLSILGAILIGILVIGNLRGLSYYKGCLRCSKGIHSQMLSAIVSTNLSFFNNNPSGRILNRFSRDLSGTDELFAKFGLDLFQCLGLVVGCLLVAISVNPWLLIPVCVLVVVLLLARHFCLLTSKELKRVEGIVRSPVYAHINASLQGLVTIRSHNAERLLHFELSRYLDLHTSVTQLFYSVMASMGLVQELTTNTYIAICILSYTLLKSDTSTDTTAGLIITQSMSVLMFLQWAIKVSAEVANQVTCVERALEYANLEPEETDTEDLVEPDKSWPQFGMIEMKNVYLRYDLNEPFVLRNLNFTVLPKEKVGIVGRTGAGKSSLIAALFRLAPLEGVVYLDAVETGSVPLEVLRSRISIIPQDPVLFSGTLRRNLDPFGKYSDSQIINVLQEVKLMGAGSSTNPTYRVLPLDSEVTDGGGNFSVGQRQMVCLARAILRNNQVLVLDEATANVDPQTDALIQSTIRRLFAHCTVLTVAHRLNTIIDCDRVLVMDAGAVAEFDHPHILLTNEHGVFYSLVRQTGPAKAEELALIAQQNYKSKEL